MNADGSDASALSIGKGDQPQWLPDGTRIVYADTKRRWDPDLGQLPTDWEIQVVSADGRTYRRELTTDDHGGDYLGGIVYDRGLWAVGWRWSPDRTRIAYTTRRLRSGLRL